MNKYRDFLEVIAKGCEPWSMEDLKELLKSRENEMDSASQKLMLMNHIQLENKLLCDLDDVIDEYMGLISVAQILGVINIEKFYLIRQQEQALNKGGDI